MSMNLEAILKITAQVAGESNVRALSSGIQSLETNAKSLKSTFKDVISSSAFQAAAVGAAALTAAIVVSTQKAMAFESSLADVRKVVDGLDNAKGLEAIKRELFDLSRQIPLTATEFAQLYAAAGQSGVARADLKTFATDVAKLAVAFDMTAAEAGSAMAKLKASLGLTLDELRLLADGMNYLSNNMGVAGSQIVEFTLRTANTGKAVNMSATDVAAFGTAMMATGAAAEVAATSFNNMLKALGKGSSMTDRQIGALVQLGYATKTQANAERDLTQAVERESAARVQAIEEESRRVTTDIRRRYRDIRQIMQDGWDDEATSYQDSLDDRYDAQRKAIERQRRAEIDASNDRAKLSGADNSRELDAIEDKYDLRLKALSRSQRDEATQWQRGQRDHIQGVLDGLEDQEQAELKAAEAKYEELKKIEELRKKELLAQAKATADAMVKELGPEMAKRLNKDAVGTIRDVFQRIRNLPQEMQLQVVSDLFGDEARALLPLITNAGLLDKALGLVADKNKFAGATAKEFASYVETSAAKSKMAAAAIDELVITFGSSFAPVLVQVLRAIAPIADAFSRLMQACPALGTAIVIVSGAFIGLVAVAPFLVSFIQLLGMLRTAMGIGAVVQATSTALTVGGAAMGASGPVFQAGIRGILQAFNPLFAATLPQRLAAIWGTIQFALMDFGTWLTTKAGPLLLNGLRVAFQGVMTFFTQGGLMTAVRTALMAVGQAFSSFFGPGLMTILGTGLRIIVGFLSGPVGWALLIAGVVALIYQFREQIGAFFVWVGTAISGWIQSLYQWGEPIRLWWASVWERAKEVFSGFVTWFGTGLYNWFVKPWIDLGNLIAQAAAAIWERVKTPILQFFDWWRINLYKLFVEPFVVLGPKLVEITVQVFDKIKQAIVGAWQSVSNAFNQYVIQPVTQGWNNLVQTVSQAANSIGNAIKGAWNGVVQTFNDLVVRPISQAWSGLVQEIGRIWQQVTGTFSSALKMFSDTFGTVFKAIATAFETYVASPLKAAWEKISTGISVPLQRAVELVKGAYQSLVGAVVGAFNGIVGAVKGVLNQIIGGINSLIRAVNVVRGAVGLSPLLQISYLAEGGYIDKPTQAVIGEGGQPEYVIPESKFEAAAKNYLSGVRGKRVLTATPPPVRNNISPGRPSAAPAPAGGTSGPISVNVTTGPVMEFDGTRYVTLADMQQAVSEAARQTQDRMLRDLRQPGTRQRLGIS